MRASQDLSRISTRFDDPNLVSHAGLLAPVSLAQALGLADLVDTHLTMSGPGSANRGLKTLSVVPSRAVRRCIAISQFISCGEARSALVSARPVDVGGRHGAATRATPLRFDG